MDIATLPLADSDSGLIRLIVLVVVIGGIGILKWLGKTVEEARENARMEQLRRERERREAANPPPVQPPPVQRPMQTPTPTPGGERGAYYPPTPARPSQRAAPPVRPMPTGTGSQRDFGGAVLLPSPAGRPLPVPVPKRPTPAPPRPGQPVRQTPAPAASNEPPQAVLLLKQVEQQIGILEGNLAKLQARRNQLSALAGVRARPTATTTATAAATTLKLNLKKPSNLRQGIIVSEILRLPVGLREEEGSWAK